MVTVLIIKHPFYGCSISVGPIISKCLDVIVLFRTTIKKRYSDSNFIRRAGQKTVLALPRELVLDDRVKGWNIRILCAAGKFLYLLHLLSNRTCAKQADNKGRSRDQVYPKHCPPFYCNLDDFYTAILKSEIERVNRHDS